MVYTYTPAYYSTLHDSITSLCKTILPFSFKKRRLPAAEQKLSKTQSDNMQWQQDSFHQILKLMGLRQEGILAEHEVSAFRSHVLETLIASPVDQEQPAILRDKLLFLQELFHATCITADEYHSSKRPLLQRLAVQGAEIEARDAIVANQKENSEEEWSVIDLRDEECLLSKENSNPNSNSKSKHRSAMKQIRGVASALSFGTPHKNLRRLEERGVNSGITELGSSRENPFWNIHLIEKESGTRSILTPESVLVETPNAQKSGGDNAKKKVSRTLFRREEGSENVTESKGKASKSGKKQWGFEGFKKWKRNNEEDETTPLPLSERSDMEPCQLAASPIGEGPDTKQIKRKLHSNGYSSDFFIDKVLGDKIKELSRIQTELSTTTHNLQFSNDRIEAVSTRLPVDKADLKKFKDHVGEMEIMGNAGRENHVHSRRWTTFEDDENNYPNLFPNQTKQTKVSYINDGNPFFH